MGKFTPEEEKELVRLMKKIEFPMPLEVFYAWHNVFGLVAAELLLMREKNGKHEVYLEYRDDRFFKGWHVQGKVHFPTETIEQTLARVIKDEVGAAVTTPKFFGWFEHGKGEKEGQSARGHGFAFVYIAEPKEMPLENETRKFFPLDKIPKDLISEHVPLMAKLREFYKS